MLKAASDRAKKKNNDDRPSGGGRGPRGSSDEVPMPSTRIEPAPRLRVVLIPIIRTALLMPIKLVTAFATSTARSRSGPLGMAFLALPKTAFRKSRSLLRELAELAVVLGGDFAHEREARRCRAA